jgi:hypothetical protein
MRCFTYIDENLSQRGYRNLVFGITAIITMILCCGIIAAVSGGWTNIIGQVIFFLIVGLSFIVSIGLSVWACFRCHSGYGYLPSEIV